MPKLDKLVEEARNLANQTGRPGFQVDRTLEGLKVQSAKSTAAVVPHSEAKAQHILAQKGFDAEALSKNINSIDLTRTFESLEPLVETDIEGFIRHEHELAIIGAIEEGQQDCVRKFEEQNVYTMELDWDRAKRQIFEDLRHHLSEYTVPGSDFFDGPIGSTTSRLRQPVPFEYSLKMQSKIKSYSEAVMSLNNSRVTKTPFLLVSAFKNVADKVDGKNSSISQAWEILQNLINENFKLQKGAYSEAYENLSPKSYSDLQKTLVNGALKFLEKQYLEYVKKKVDDNPQIAQLGGKPGIEDLIRAYLNIRLPAYSRQSLQIARNKDPVWALLYFLIRCGFWDRAQKLAETTFSAEQGVDLFSKALATYLSDPLSTVYREELSEEYKYSSGKDPFKSAIFKILGRCELTSKTIPNVTISTEDYLWLQLLLVRDDQEEYTLDILQEDICRLGREHFDPNQTSPIKYFKCLLLTAQFEEAVAFLFSQELFQTEAVHFALSLDYYGLLRKPDPSFISPDSPSLLQNKDGVTRVFDFERMIRIFIRPFIRTDPEDALHYLFLLPLAAGISEITNVVLETHQFSLLLGEFRVERKEPGYIERYAQIISDKSQPNEPSLVDRIAIRAAEESHRRGNIEDAIHLYNLAKQYNQVLEIVNNQLGYNMKQSFKATKEEYQKILTYYRLKQGVFATINKDLLQTGEILARLFDFNSAAQAGQLDHALLILESTGIFPLGSNANLKEKIAQFKFLNQNIKMNVPDAALKAVDLLAKLYQKIKSLARTDPGRQKQLSFFQKQAEDIYSFVSELEFAISPSVIADLGQMVTRMV